VGVRFTAAVIPAWCDVENLGQRARAWANSENFGIVAGQGDPRKLRGHVAGCAAIQNIKA
jgi:hypothetical protein